MKKILFLMAALLTFTIASAANETKVMQNTDIGYVVSAHQQTFAATYFFIEAWQAPVTLNKEESQMSAQVVDVISCPITMGENSMTLVCFMWPYGQSDDNYCYYTNSTRTYNDSTMPDDAYYRPFTSALAEVI